MMKMRIKNLRYIIASIMVFITAVLLAGTMHVLQLQKRKSQPPVQIKTNVNGFGDALTVKFTVGKAHNHPLMAIWMEDTLGNYIQTLFVAQSIGKGIFNYGDNSGGKWKRGEIRRPAALPYWGHKRGVMAADGLYLPGSSDPIPDAYTGATPPANFDLNTRADKAEKNKVRILLEINQPWDWNEYWTNGKYPDNKEYLSSAQPAIVYAATIDLSAKGYTFMMKPIGHSHYSGADGSLTTDLSTLTTALHIAESISVMIDKN
jgi:hypothetical protein